MLGFDYRSNRTQSLTDSGVERLVSCLADSSHHLPIFRICLVLSCLNLAQERHAIPVKFAIHEYGILYTHCKNPETSSAATSAPKSDSSLVTAGSEVNLRDSTCDQPRFDMRAAVREAASKRNRGCRTYLYKC